MKRRKGGQIGNDNGVKAEKPATTTLRCRVVPEDKEAWQSKADSNNQNLSEWVIATLNEAAGIPS